MENINLEMYKVFYYVALYKNVTKASLVLLISQPAITQTIKKLENELGYTLFYRTSRGMNLTTYGENLFNNIKNSIEVLNSCKNTLDSIEKTIPKKILIGGGTTLLKHNAIKGFMEFKEKHPDIKIEVVKGITSDLLNKLNEGLLDLVLFNKNENINENLEYKVIENCKDAFVANSLFYKELINKKLTLKDLENLPLVLQSDVSTSRKFLNLICKKNKVNFNNCYELESYDLTLSFVKAGLGIGFINLNHVKQELSNKELFVLDIEEDIEERQIAVAYNKKDTNNKYIKEFIDILTENK